MNSKIIDQFHLMLTGTTISNFHVGHKIGQGSFGEIYAIRSNIDSRLYALKVEPANTARKILDFEVMVLKTVHRPNKNPNNINTNSPSRNNPSCNSRNSPSSSPDGSLCNSPYNSPYFPSLISSGKTHTHAWYVMELLGPSLSTVTKLLPSHRLSLSTGLRVATLILRALKSFHESGFIHRDIKPENILLRRSREYPIAIIDFGLSKVYIDRKTGKLIPARSHPGFRGTAVYASPNAHMHQDLARRDDLISWYYLVIDLLNGPLPWKLFESRAEILHLKRVLQMDELGGQIVPQFSDIWKLISPLTYNDRPNYEEIEKLLLEAQAENGISMDDEDWDWHPQILQMDANDETFLEQQKQMNDFVNAQDENMNHDVNDFDYVKKRKLSHQPLLGNQSEEGCCCLLL
ncbi:CK1 family protein kinase [Tritrichomonas foetus]|uniref:non-specific serine/threonine protein kinase n=1 Tax=Tritrichomonas foetus TaxID=1144522 RepID=A0A1J4K011_9EUKA|nr:CK1 family protein kinase [Tritrichomonas foetus]|eukprot:OHT03078.1 CK1 family protein kinase [Tritrichomonas foetus]